MGNDLSNFETQNTTAQSTDNINTDLADNMPCGNTSESDLDMDLIHRIFAKHHTQIDTSKLLSIGILAQKGGRIVARNGGVILFGKPEIREKFFPFVEVKCARFAGTIRAEFIDRLEIEGSILSAIDEVPKFMLGR